MTVCRASKKWQLKKAGVTLIEVVASLLLCGLLFSVVIASFARHREQIENAQLILISTREMDLLVARWYWQGSPLPVGDTGPLDLPAELSWSLSAVETEVALVDRGIQKCRLASWYQGKEVCGIEILVESHSERSLRSREKNLSNGEQIP